MTRLEVIASLRAENPRARADHLAIYADAYIEYLRCQADIAKRGAVLETKDSDGNVIKSTENPYLGPRDRASKTMRDIRIKADGLWGH